MKWKLKKDIRPVGSSDGFWYDITLGGSIKPEELLDDKEQLRALEEAIKLINSFENYLEEKELLNEF